MTTLGTVPASRPLNPTVMLLLVVVLWAVIDRAFPGTWLVTLLITAAAVNALLWLHGRWRRGRKARGLDRTRPYVREDELA